MRLTSNTLQILLRSSPSSSPFLMLTAYFSSKAMSHIHITPMPGKRTDLGSVRSPAGRIWLRSKPDLKSTDSRLSFHDKAQGIGLPGEPQAVLASLGLS